MSKCIGVIRKARPLLNRSSLITLYYTFLYPYMTYCLHVWGGTYQNTLLPIVKIQKAAIRTIFGLSKYHESSSLFKELQILKFNDVYTCNINTFVFRYLTDKLPIIFNNFFVTNADIHHYNTRIRNQFHIPICRTTLSQMTFKYMAVKQWNECGYHLIKSSGINISLTKFKNLLRIKLLTTY